MFTIIAAIGKNNELGKNNKLIWKLPQDLKFFKEQTEGKKILMGRNTYESLPKKLENREYYVVTRTKLLEKSVQTVSDLESFIIQHKTSEEEIMVIGGAQVYEQLLEHCNKLILTEIEAEEIEADVFFPSFLKSAWKRKVVATRWENGIFYHHVVYDK